MNERIRQLEQQAMSIVLNGNDPDSDVDKMYIPLEFTKKFAQLIVRECIEQASIGNGHGNNQWDRALTFASKNIKEHFGVER
jgi:hypothetical protein